MDVYLVIHKGCLRLNQLLYKPVNVKIHIIHILINVYSVIKDVQRVKLLHLIVQLAQKQDN